MGTSRVCRCPLTFCTVIRPAIRPADSPSITASKRHIRAFIKRLSRKHPQAAGYWKMELQERGAVHYHLLILGVEWMDTAWLADVWHEIAAPGEERNRQAGTHVGHVRSIPRVIRYMAKRFHVPDALSLSNVGRCWGRFVNVTVHEGQSRTTVVSFEQAQDVSRTMDKLRKAQLCRGGTSIVTPAPLPHLRRSGTLSSKWYLGDVEQLVRVIDQGQGHMPTRPVHKLRHGKPTIFERVPISRPGSFGAWYRSVSGLKIIGRDAERSDDDGASSIGARKLPAHPGVDVSPPNTVTDHQRESEWERTSLSMQVTLDTLYVGCRTGNNARYIIVLNPDGTQHHLPHVGGHSGELNWGYKGSGPTDTAISLLRHAAAHTLVASPDDIEGMIASYKEDVVEGLGSEPLPRYLRQVVRPDTGTILWWCLPQSEVRRWLRNHLSSQQLERYLVGGSM